MKQFVLALFALITFSSAQAFAEEDFFTIGVQDETIDFSNEELSTQDLVAPMAIKTASPFGTWVTSGGNWPDSYEVIFKLSQKQATLKTTIIYGGTPCTTQITVPVKVDAQYITILRSKTARNQSWGVNCSASVSAGRGSYTIKGRKLTLRQGGRTTVYTRR